jgi:tetratricopeptide (TPR) repeat protein
MAEPATGFERGFEHAAYSPVPSSPIAPSDIRGDQSDSAHSELASLIRLGTIKQDAGSFAEAEECFRRALEIGDRTFGPENPDSIILLNDLTRLYLKQSAYSSAEPLLLRLLEIKRSKGEDHPEVATVLASLATVRQGLGMHESGEQLWRRVLDIRERTLAPNHFATASALEHLGDACAARGKIREGLSAFQRALTIREKTLGNEHPSLRVARERIADLQLQASDDMLDPMSVGDTPSMPDRYRLLSGGPTADTSANRFAPPVTPPAAPQIRVTAQVAGKVSPAPEPKPVREKKSSSASLMIPRGYMPPAAPAIDIEKEDKAETVVFAMPAIEPILDGEGAGSSLQTATVAYRDALEGIRDEVEDEFSEQTVGDRTSKIFSAIIAFLGRRQVVAVIAIVVLSLLGAAVATDKHAFGESSQTATEPSGTAITASTVPTATAQPIPVPVSNASVSNTENSTKASRSHVTEERSSASKKPVEKKPEQPSKVSIPNLSSAILSKLDSAAAKAAAVGNHAGEASFNVQSSLSAVSQKRATFTDEQSSAPQRARLIGELPTPAVPPQVVDVEGEVRVRFNVDTLGRPMIETFSVVSSPNPLLTAAVRKVIPGMRFEPARTGGSDAKAIGDVVQIGFQFARSR